MQQNDLMNKIVSLCKRRGFVYPGSEIYGGLANSFDYGPLGVELKNNIKQLWWKRFVQSRDDVVGLDSSLIMNTKVWEASGHLKEFYDSISQCKNCNFLFRDDDLPGFNVRQIDPSDRNAINRISEFLENSTCTNCGQKGKITFPALFNLMFETNLGPVKNERSKVYLRPETAQGMFVDFKSVLDTTRKQLPFGIAQIGRAFRNEITPGNFIFRTREFEMMEIEYFINPPKSDKEWNKHFEKWRKEMHDWMKVIGLSQKKIHELEVPDKERAHYSKRTIDFEYDFPFGRKELYGLAYRTDFDLQNHMKFSGQSLEYTDSESGKKFVPHVIEPTWGVDRSVLAVLCQHYDDSDKERTVLHLPFNLAPYKVAIFPLLKNKPELVKVARKIYDDLRKDPPAGGMVAFDDRGNIGKRYYSQDEIGTPYCVTVDFQTLEDKTVTLRNRDTAKQERVAIAALEKILKQK